MEWPCHSVIFNVSGIITTSTKGVDASASIFSLIETAKANRLSPFDYIEYILEIMSQIYIIQHPEKIDWFMPWSDQIKEEFGIKDD